MKLATQRTLQLGEVVDDTVDLELDLPLGVFLCNQCADSVDEKAMVANVKEWCERREHKGDCHAVDPGMCTTLVEIMKLRASSKDLARTKSEMIQEGEGLKERCAVAAKAMKNRITATCRMFMAMSFLARLRRPSMPYSPMSKSAVASQLQEKNYPFQF